MVFRAIAYLAIGTMMGRGSLLAGGDAGRQRVESFTECRTVHLAEGKHSRRQSSAHRGYRFQLSPLCGGGHDVSSIVYSRLWRR
jgi:hypothetical protein